MSSLITRLIKVENKISPMEQHTIFYVSSSFNHCRELNIDNQKFDLTNDNRNTLQIINEKKKELNLRGKILFIRLGN
jgi:hypothetical protein